MKSGQGKKRGKEDSGPGGGETLNNKNRKKESMEEASQMIADQGKNKASHEGTSRKDEQKTAETTGHGAEKLPYKKGDKGPFTILMRKATREDKPLTVIEACRVLDRSAIHNDLTEKFTR
jgi:hypothetical protein